MTSEFISQTIKRMREDHNRQLAKINDAYLKAKAIKNDTAAACLQRQMYATKAAFAAERAKTAHAMQQLQRTVRSDRAFYRRAFYQMAAYLREMISQYRGSRYAELTTDRVQFTENDDETVTFTITMKYKSKR